jgi:cysteinyl-tRNA synthetase
VELRYYLAVPHYRSVIDFSEEALHEAASAYRRLEGFVRRAAEVVDNKPSRGNRAAPLRAAFIKAMDDDLNTSKAIALVHDLVHSGYASLADGDSAATRKALVHVRAMLDVLGLDPLSPQWAANESGELRGVVDSLVALALEQRAAARTRKDWPAADGVRDQLKAAGVVVEDTNHGPRWTIEGR